MMICNAATAREFVHAWLRESTPGRARRHIAACLESQHSCLIYDISKRRHDDAQNTREAIIVLGVGLAEANRLQRDCDDARLWAGVCMQWHAIGEAIRRRYPTRT